MIILILSQRFLAFIVLKTCGSQISICFHWWPTRSLDALSSGIRHTSKAILLLAQWRVPLRKQSSATCIASNTPSLLGYFLCGSKGSSCSLQAIYRCTEGGIDAHTSALPLQNSLGICNIYGFYSLKGLQFLPSTTIRSIKISNLLSAHRATQPPLQICICEVPSPHKSSCSRWWR